MSAVIGVLIALIWLTYSTDRPEQHPRVTPSELAKIQAPYDDSGSNGAPRGKLPLLVLVRNRNVYLLILSNFLFGYVAYIYLTWFYLYLVDVREFSILQGSFYATLPFVAITILTPIGCTLHPTARVPHYPRNLPLHWSVKGVLNWCVKLLSTAW